MTTAGEDGPAGLLTRSLVGNPCQTGTEGQWLPGLGLLWLLFSHTPDILRGDLALLLT